MTNKLFAVASVCRGTLNGRLEDILMTGPMIAKNEDEARGMAFRQSFEKYPNYSIVNINVVEVTLSTISCVDGVIIKE